jgi:hypothetical protein
VKLPRYPILLLCLVELVLPLALPAQGRDSRLRVSTEAALHSAPSGTRIAEVLPGAQVAPGAERRGWHEVTVEGWISEKSVRPARGGRYALEVAGEGVVRAAPGGAPVVNALGGMVLRELKRDGAWIQVQRTGWVPASAFAPAPRPATALPGPAAPRPAGPAPAPPAPIGVVVQSGPAGDTLAVLPAGAPVEVLERNGEWSRVRMEGWTRSPVRVSSSEPGVRALRESPETYRGREVRWSARFLALRRAEAIRSDFTAGEPYILARDPNGESGLVYIAVTPQQALAARRLLPLQKFAFTARVRTGQSALMGHPVLELVELRP